MEKKVSCEAKDNMPAGLLSLSNLVLVQNNGKQILLVYVGYVNLMIIMWVGGLAIACNTWVS